MKLIAATLLVFGSLFSSAVALADDDHGIGLIENADMNLKYENHVLTGTIGGIAIKAEPTDAGFELTHRVGDQDFVAVFGKVGNQFKGTVESVKADGTTVSAEFVLTKADVASGTILGTLNGKSFKMQMTADAMAGHHFLSPNFLYTSENAEYAFAMNGGQACIGCAVNLSFAILSMLSITGTL